MANTIINAAPMVIEYGTQDLSTRQLPREPEIIPQHLPKFFLYTRKGPSEPQLVVGNERDLIFGSESFDTKSKYFNHSTVFANAVNAEGNACMIQRILPVDTGPASNMLVYLDVLPTTVDLYERNLDGSIHRNATTGAPTIEGTTQGYKIKWVVDYRKTAAEIAAFGTATQLEGSQTDPVTRVKSTRYPIFELKTSSPGEHGNLSGIRLWAPTTNTLATMPVKMMNTEMAYPYFLSVIRKTSTTATPKVQPSIWNDHQMMFTFKEDVTDPVTGLRLNLQETMIERYQNLNDVRYPKLFGDFSDLHVYHSQIDTVLDLFFASETPYFQFESDFRLGYDGTYETTQKHLFNFVTLVSSGNIPYHSVVFMDDATSTRFSELSNVYARGGSDGQMDDDRFAGLVSEAVLEYADRMSTLQDLVTNPESILYDTGFPMSVKKDLAAFIAERKDTCVIWSTHTAGQDHEDAVGEAAVASELQTYIKKYPESDYFGTPVMRGMVIGRSARYRNSPYTKRLPLSLEVAIKSARYMGAGNGSWTNGKHFDGAPGSVVDSMFDINITWVPASVRNRNWDIGLNWVQAYDRRSFFFPALKTVYSDDTSVLNSYFTMIAICQLNKVAHAAWREFSGVSHLSNSQLISKVNDFVKSRVINRFDERFVIVPDCIITDLDALRGYSFTLPIRIYSANMKTVLTTYVQAFRLEDLGQTP
jgi:hypothetical protein